MGSRIMGRNARKMENTRQQKAFVFEILKMRTFCLCLPEEPERMLRADNHFTERGLGEIDWFFGLHGEQSGLRTTLVYGLDADKSYVMGPKPVGIWLGHYILWSHLARIPDEYAMIVEVDAKFPEDWKRHLDDAISRLPDGFDFLFPGHCCLNDAAKIHVGGNVYRTEKPQCTHAYIVRTAILSFALQKLRKVWSPWDIQIMLEIFPIFRTYAIIPRLIDQWDTDIGAP